MNKKKELFCCLIFLVTLYGLWAADLLCRDRLYSDWEKRMLAQRPEPVAADILDGSYGRAYEEWLMDQFPARDWWVSLKTRCELLLGRKEIDGILIGKDGCLFSENKRTADWDRLTEQMTEQYGADRVSRIRVPSAGSVLKEKLPYGISFPSEEDSVWSSLYAHRQEYIYYRTDHHWTMRGAWYAYEVWARERGLKPVPLEDMAYSVVKEAFLGTHYARLHYANRADAIEVFDPGIPCTAVYDLGDSRLTGLYRPEHLESEDAYRYFLDGNHPVVQIETEKEDGHLVVLKDSFANCFVPFLTQHYKKITVIDPRYFRADAAEWLKDQEVTEVLLLYQDTVRRTGGGT